MIRFFSADIQQKHNIICLSSTKQTKSTCYKAFQLVADKKSSATKSNHLLLKYMLENKSRNLRMTDTMVEAPKMFREIDGVVQKNVQLPMRWKLLKYHSGVMLNSDLLFIK